MKTDEAWHKFIKVEGPILVCLRYCAQMHACFQFELISLDLQSHEDFKSYITEYRAQKGCEELGASEESPVHSFRLPSGRAELRPRYVCRWMCFHVVCMPDA